MVNPDLEARCIDAIKEFQNGKKVNIGILWETYANEIEVFLKKKFRVSNDKRKDILQEMAYKLLTDVPKQFDTNTKNLEGYIIRTTRNTYIDIFRKEQRQKRNRNGAFLEFFPNQTKSDSKLPDVYVEDKEAREVLYEILENCSQTTKQQEAINLVKEVNLNELSYKEVQKKYNLPMNTVKTKIFRGTELIKKHVEKHPIYKSVFGQT